MRQPIGAAVQLTIRYFDVAAHHRDGIAMAFGLAPHPFVEEKSVNSRKIPDVVLIHDVTGWRAGIDVGISNHD